MMAQTTRCIEALVPMLLVMAGSAFGAEHSCESVDKSAKVYTATESVTRSEDKAAKKCSFSINGATSTTSSISFSSSDMASKVSRAYFGMRARGVDEYFSLLPDLLVAAGENRMNVKQLWNNDAIRERLRHCLLGFLSRSVGADIESEKVKFGTETVTVSCKPSANSSGDTLEISISAEQRSNVLYIPLPPQ